MATIYIEFDDKDALAAIQRAADALGDMPRVLRNIGEYLLGSTFDRFEAEVSPDGVAWAPLSPRYAARKAKKYPGKGILRREDVMHDRTIFQVEGADTLLLGTNARHGGFNYPAAMQLGTSRVPARPWLGVSEEDVAEIHRITLDYLQSALDGTE